MLSKTPRYIGLPDHRSDPGEQDLFPPWDQNLLQVAWIANVREDLDVTCYKIFLAIMALLATSLFWHYWKIIRIERTIKKIPGPPIWPITGNAHSFFGLDEHGKYNNLELQIAEEYGGTCRVWFGPYLMVFLAEPRYIEAVLKSEYASNKDPTYRFFKPLGEGIFIASGENWKELRKMVNPTFNQKILESFTKCFNEESKILVNVLEKKVDAPTFDIHNYVARTALDILCGTQMNVKTSEQKDNTSDFAKYVCWSARIMKERFFKLYLQPDILYCMTERSKQCKKYVQHLYKFVKKIIQKRKLARKEECVKLDSIIVEEKKRVFLDAILDHFKDLSDDQLVIKITDMFVAGTDTIAIIVSYALMILGLYKDKQEMVYKEMVDAIGESNENITYVDLPKLRYLEMVLKEVLRHYTIQFAVRRLEKDTYIDDNIKLPASTSVYISVYGVHRDRRFWKHPDDFYPEHFLPEEVEKRPKYSYIPFLMGPRNCPGYAFAMMSMKIVVATVIKNYKIHSDVDLKNLQFNNTFIMGSKNGYPVQISRRKKNSL
ncbi:cytochrome P450 4C1-like [Lycorma delicatula]|uniref:cytochrome P450 4C1-like n=1 Tax=Lycorma delicatula TaxID=130591 RepID=UPI003F50FE75